MTKPLDIPGGVRVLESAEGIAGPAADQQLADPGATALKIEPPQGNRWRGRVDSAGGARPGAIFEYLNRDTRALSRTGARRRGAPSWMIWSGRPMS